VVVSDDAGEVEVTRIAYACPHCSARIEMTPEQTQRFAFSLLAQAAGLQLGSFDVRGSG
jgi:hypothetical protein